MTEINGLQENATEDELIANFKEIFAQTHNFETKMGIGDDCALFESSSSENDKRVLVSTDILTENTHFKRKWSSPEMLAKRAFMQNVADIAASGGRATGLTCALTMSGDVADNFALRFASELAEIARKARVAVLGGDLARGENLTISITIFGTLDGREQVMRSGAKVGDIVALAGELGFSAQGLAEFESLTALDDIPKRVIDSKAMQRYLAPEPPYYDGAIAAKAGATAMIDISDGLLKDASRIAKASVVSIFLNPRADQKMTADEYYYFGGEDHALLATFPAGTVLPKAFSAIGIVREFNGNYVEGADLAGLSGEVWEHWS